MDDARRPQPRIDPDLGMERALRQAAEIIARRAAEIAAPAPEEVDVARLRAAFGMTQIEFASTIGIPVGTLRNWEQGRRRPEGPARVLLQLIAANPDAALRTLAKSENAA